MTRMLFFVCALALLVPASSSAGPRFGIEGGGSLVWTEYGYGYDEDAIDLDYEPRFEFNAAATVHFDFTPTWGLTTGLRYSRLGDNTEGVFRPANEPYETVGEITLIKRQEYLSIPLLARLSFNSDLRPFLFGGTEVAWLIQATVNNEGQVHEVTESTDRYNVTAVIGAGVEIGVGDHGLELAVRYGYGLTDIAKSNEFFPVHVKQKTRELALTLGFRL